MRVFISLPMAGKSEDCIKAEMEYIKSRVLQMFPAIADFIDSYIQGDPPEGVKCGVWYLGKSIELLAQADLVAIAKDWGEARGCVIEHAVAVAYGIPIFEIYIP